MVLDVGGVRLGLATTPGGPELDLDEPWLESMQWIVNLAIRRGGQELADALRKGHRVTDQEMFVEPEVPESEIASAVPRWRAVSGRDLRAEGPLVLLRTGFVPLATVVPRDWLADVIQALVAARASEAVDPPWLFRRPAVAEYPHDPGDQQAVEQLELRLRRLDEAVARLADAEREPADLLAERRALLVDLDAHGLLSEEHAVYKRRWLATWGLAQLAAYYAAALELLGYLRSDERRRYNPAAGDEPVIGAPVSVDLFRSGLFAPDGVDRLAWASWGEHLLHESDVEGEQGEILHHDQDGWVTVLWRCDAPGAPAVLSVALAGPDTA